MSTDSASFADRGPVVFSVTTATLVLCSIFVFSRLISRVGIVRRVGWDDYLITLAWLLAFGLSLTINLATRTGLGRHDKNIPAGDRARLRVCEYVFSILYNPALMATKSSILIFYLRLSKKTIQVLRMGSYIVLVIVNVAGTVLTFINIFQCRPVAAGFSDIPGQCIPLLTEFICSAPVNIITDLAILALPIPFLTGMRLPSRQKTILVLTFALGVFVTVVDVVRIYYLQQAILIIQPGSSSDPNSIFGDGTDFAWNASLSFMWSAVEVNVGITCACIPTLKPLVIKIFPALVIDPYASIHDSSSRARGASHSSPGSPLAASQTSHTRMSPSSRPGTANVPPGASKEITATANTSAFANVVSSSIGREGSGTPLIAEGEPAGSREPDPELDSSFDLGVHERPNLASHRIATADHAPQEQPPLSPTASRTLQQSSTAGILNSESQNAEQSPRSPIARVTSGTRHAFTAATHMLHSSKSDRSRSGRRRKDKTLYFGFVKLHTPKNMLEASVSESIKYCTIVAVLFFLWGFSYGLLNTLNNVVAAVSNMTMAQTLGLTSAYFGGGYFFGPLLVGEWVLRHDEHHRLRGLGPQRHIANREQREKRGGSRGVIPATSASLGSVAASATTNQSRNSDSLMNNVGGFKATFMVGLCIYGIGTMMFWPSVVLTSFPGFLISSFVVGFGLGVLETAANPFIALCGPLEYSEMRLLIVQAAQAVGSVLSGLLAQNVFFVDVGTEGRTNSTTLLDVQWTYLAITLFCVILALFFYYIPLPELHDAELEEAASRLPVDGKKKSFFGLQLRTVCLVLAVFAQWTYVASQESMSIYFYQLVTSWLPGGAATEAANITRAVKGQAFSTIVADRATSSVGPNDNANKPAGLNVSVPNYLLIAHTTFAISRAATGYIVYLGVKHPKNRWLPSPRTILTISTALVTLFALLIVVLKPSQNPNLVMIPVTLYFFAEGPVWPLVFAIGLRGQGTRTKRAAVFITMGASGPLFWPYVMYAIMRDGGTIQIAFIVVVALMAACTLYPLFITFVRDARDLTKVAPLNPQGEDGSAGVPQASGAMPPSAPSVLPGELDLSILATLPDGRSGKPKTEQEQKGKDEPRDEQQELAIGSASTAIEAGPSNA